MYRFACAVAVATATIGLDHTRGVCSSRSNLQRTQSALLISFSRQIHFAVDRGSVHDRDSDDGATVAKTQEISRLFDEASSLVESTVRKIGGSQDDWRGLRR